MSAYPPAREVLMELIDGNAFDGETVTAYLRLQPDFVQHLPAVLIYSLGGTETYLDRVDRVGVDVYADAGTQAVDVAEAIRASIVDQPHETSLGYVDNISAETTPVDVPYADPNVSQAQAVYRVTSRPL